MATSGRTWFGDKNKPRGIAANTLLSAALTLRCALSLRAAHCRAFAMTAGWKVVGSEKTWRERVKADEEKEEKEGEENKQQPVMLKVTISHRVTLALYKNISAVSSAHCCLSSISETR